MPTIAEQNTDKIIELEKHLYQMEIQVNTVLNLSKAINSNASEAELFDIFHLTLTHEVLIHRMIFLYRESSGWEIKSALNCTECLVPEMSQIIKSYPRPTIIQKKDKKELFHMEYIIPVWNGDEVIACILIGDVTPQGNFFHNFSFITSLANLISLAIDNKRNFIRKLERERFRNEMNLASEVQKLIVPQEWPQQDHLKVSSIYKPLWNVGGDYIDCFLLDNNRTAFCVADVSGKGISAALVMANFQGIVHQTLNSNITLDKLVDVLNRAVLQTTKNERIITFFVAEYNRKTKTLQYLNAGHVPPFLYTQGSCMRLDKGTTLLGIVENIPMVLPEIIELRDDATMVLYTDGITDIVNRSGENFEDAILCDFVENHHQLDVKEFTYCFPPIYDLSQIE